MENSPIPNLRKKKFISNKKLILSLLFVPYFGQKIKFFSDPGYKKTSNSLQL